MLRPWQSSQKLKPWSVQLVDALEGHPEFVGEEFDEFRGYTPLCLCRLSQTVRAALQAVHGSGRVLSRAPGRRQH